MDDGRPGPWGELVLDIVGLGIVLYSPSAAQAIVDGENYLEAHYWSAEDVVPHLMEGSIIGFGTGGPGTFVMRLRAGYPDAGAVAEADFTLRLGLRSDGVVVFRDLYDLVDWDASYSHEQAIPLGPGIYHVTLCTRLPPSGLVGDVQEIDVYFNAVEDFPDLAYAGVPSLC
ncbi:MAG: hypothetical protein ACTHN0_18650 [Aquihabitans sp.]